MSVDEIVELLDEDDEVAESYVLLREIKAYLNVGHDSFRPQIGIKIYKSNITPNGSFHFEVSHYVCTPIQAGAYTASIASFYSEDEAIKHAISTTTSYIKGALQAGHEPDDKWLIPNEDF